MFVSGAIPQDCPWCALLSTFAQATWEADPDGRIHDSPSWRGYTGQSAAECLNDDGFGWLAAIHPDDRISAEAQWRNCLAHLTNLDTEFRLFHAASQAYRWTNVHATPLRTPDGRIEKWVGLNIDIHERKLAQQALQQHAETLRQNLTDTQAELHALSQRLLSTLEDERRRIASDLHDSLGQQAALIGLEAGQLQQMDNLPDGAHPILQRLRLHIATLAQEIHDVSRTLHPAVVANLGLPAALRSLIEEHRRAGIDVAIDIESCPPLPIDAATAIYRIVQEALSNAIHHAPGSPVRLWLGCEHENRDLVLRIEDDGPGFDLATSQTKGRLGLIGMQQRANLYGGTLRIDTAPGTRTRIQAILPIASLKPNQRAASGSLGTRYS